MLLHDAEHPSRLELPLVNSLMVTISNLSKRYGSNPPVLQQIDLAIEKGEFISLIGPSGLRQVHPAQADLRPHQRQLG